MSIIDRLHFALLNLRKPTRIIRFIDKDGRKKIVVFQCGVFGAKAVGKFEIAGEFDPKSFDPNWEPVHFWGADFRKGFPDGSSDEI